MSVSPLFIVLESTELGGVSKWLVGGSLFVFLLLVMGALLAFGGGRDHS